MSFKTAFSLTNMQAIHAHLGKHRKILSIILSASPTQLQPHIKDCVINKHSLMVYVSSAVWASQLRFYSTQIKEAVNIQSNEKIKQIRIRVIQPEPFIADKPVTKIIPSNESITLLHDSAESLTEGKLKNALLRLSTVLQKQAK